MNEADESQFRRTGDGEDARTKWPTWKPALRTQAEQEGQGKVDRRAEEAQDNVAHVGEATVVRNP